MTMTQVQVLLDETRAISALLDEVLASDIELLSEAERESLRAALRGYVVPVFDACDRLLAS